VNATVSLLSGKASPAEVLNRLVAQYGISRRQAYRYFRLAQSARAPVPVPEIKQVFTVKLPAALIGQVRQQARQESGSISQWVEGVLRRALNPPPGHG
jgi:hypothetical protein